ncbi:hypothetical protein [Chondromyces apiculatus]|nr:hypothetical protein [Chondromyces apiculatus]
MRWKWLGITGWVAAAIGSGACTMLSSLEEYDRMDGAASNDALGSEGGAGGGGGGSGGAGGAGGGMGGSGGSGGAGGTGGTGGTGGGTTTTDACPDNAGMECSQDSACGTCAIDFGGPCYDEFVACASDTECVNFAVCINNCSNGDFDCEDACVAAYPGSVSTYDETQFCVICTACPLACDAASNPTCTP